MTKNSQGNTSHQANVRDVPAHTAKKSRYRLTAQNIIDIVFDEGTFIPWDYPEYATRVNHSINPKYSREILDAQRKTGLEEALIIGEGKIHGRRIAVIATEFNFLAGSVGVETAERLVYAIERATAERLPLISSPTSGGTRMQEGVLAFVQMVKISTAAALHKKAGLPLITYLRDPTFGGVFASWGSLGHITGAQPEARIGFLGPRVYEALYNQRFPDNVQVAENLFAHGILDGVVRTEVLRWLCDRVLTVLCGDVDPTLDPGKVELITQANDHQDVWKSVQTSRNPQRPDARTVVRNYVTEYVPLSGTGAGEHSSALLLALGRFRGYPSIILAQSRNEDQIGPISLREARRGMGIAKELQLPLVMLIDTWGASLSPEAEQGGLAGEIARCLAELSLIETHTCSVLLGQGTGGGALALLPADTVLCAENAWLAPLPPEGSSAVIYKDTSQAQKMAIEQQISSSELLRQGIVDAIIPEPHDPATEPEEFSRRVGDAIASTLARFHHEPMYAHAASRHFRYRNLGTTI